MAKRSLYETLTQPPPRRPPPPKYPLFTKDPLSTKSFSPGHLLGAGVLFAGLFGLTRFFIRRGQEQSERSRQLAQSPQAAPTALPPAAPARAASPALPVDRSKIAQVENQRGQYGPPGVKP